MSVHRVFRSVSRAARAVGADKIAGVVEQVGAVVASIQQFAEQVKGFVSALSPATVQILDQELKNLQATVGQAFLPAVQVWTQAVRDFADRISPVMEKLAPVFERAASSLAEGVAPLLSALATLAPPLAELGARVSSALIPVFDGLARVVLDLLPLTQIVVDLMPVMSASIEGLMAALQVALFPVVAALQILSAVVQGLAPVLEVVRVANEGIALVLDTMSRIMQALGESIAAFVRSLGPLLGMGDAAANLKSLFQDLARNLVALVAVIAKSVGALDFLKRLEGAFRPKEDEKGVRAQAAGPTAIKGLEQITKDIATASAQAQGKGGESEADRARREEAEWRKRVADDIAEYAKNGKTFQQWLEKKFDEVIDWLKKPYQDAKAKVEEVADQAKQKAGAGLNDLESRDPTGAIKWARGKIGI